MILLIVPIVACSIIYYHAVIKRDGSLLTADSLFVFSQVVMAVGSLVLLDTRYEADQAYGYILAYTVIAYMIASGVIRLAAAPPVPISQVPIPTAPRPGHTFWLLAILSAIIVVAYYYSVGYSAFFRGLANQLTAGNREDITGLRLDSYSGSRYLFPGYVNQFKNALLPALVVLAITYWVRSGQMKRRLIPALGWSLLTLFGLLGTGQRGSFVISMAVLVVYLYLSNKGNLPKQVFLLAMVFVGVILLSTIALGRSNDRIGDDGGIGTRSSVAVQDFTDRILTVNQASGVIGFRYIYANTEVQNGRELFTSLLSVLPQYRGSDLANDIFAYRYGSHRGTSPPSIWGDMYYNFGYAGVVIAPFVFAGILARISRAGIKPVQRTSMETMGIAGVFTVLGFWVAGSPLFLLNSGILVYAAMWVIGARQRTRVQRLDSRKRSLVTAEVTRRQVVTS